MIGNKLEQSIISVFENDLTSTFSINQVSKILKKSYPNINKKSNYFIKEGILKKINIGRSYQCYLDLNSEKTRVFLKVDAINKKEKLLRDHSKIRSMLSELELLNKNHNLYSVIFYKNSLIFVIHNKNKDKIIDCIRKDSWIDKQINTIFWDENELKNFIIENPDFNSENTLLFGIDNYLVALSDLSEKLLLKSLIKEDK